MLQKEWSGVDYKKNMTVIGLMQFGRRKRIVAIGSYAEVENNMAEVAFLVKEELHGMGVGTRLLEILEEIAKKNNFTGFTAIVLAENNKMIKVFKKRYPNAKFTRGGSGEIDVEMPFKAVN